VDRRQRSRAACRQPAAASPRSRTVVTPAASCRRSASVTTALICSGEFPGTRSSAIAPLSPTRWKWSRSAPSARSRCRGRPVHTRRAARTPPTRPPRCDRPRRAQSHRQRGSLHHQRAGLHGLRTQCMATQRTGACQRIAMAPCARSGCCRGNDKDVCRRFPFASSIEGGG